MIILRYFSFLHTKSFQTPDKDIENHVGALQHVHLYAVGSSAIEVFKQEYAKNAITDGCSTSEKCHYRTVISLS